MTTTEIQALSMELGAILNDHGFRVAVVPFKRHLTKNLLALAPSSPL